MKPQPNSRFCFVCGMENDSGLHIRFYDGEPNPAGQPTVSAEITVPKQFQGYPGVVHGGIVASMLDEVASRTVFSSDPPRFVVTAKLNIRYRKPVPVDQPLQLTGVVEEDKGKIITTNGKVFGPGGMLLAEAEVILVEVEQQFFGDVSMEDQGWQVYPE